MGTEKSVIRVVSPNGFAAPARRLRARRVSEGQQAELAVSRANETGLPAIRAAHGGSVANAYGYRAETETLVTVAFPGGLVVQWHGRQSANKVSHAWAGDLFDGRCGAERKAASRADWIRRALDALVEAGAMSADDALVALDLVLSTTALPPYNTGRTHASA